MQYQPIVIVAALPPPVNGNFVATKAAVDALKQSTPVLVYNLSAKSEWSHLTGRIIKVFRSLVSLFKIIEWRFRKPLSLYTVANSAGGLYLNIATIGLARLLGYRCVLHHHSYSYLNTFDWRMKIIDRLLGTRGTHVVLAPEMESRFRDIYNSASQFCILPNTFIMKDIPASSSIATTLSDRTFRLGHISNLTMAKGLKHVLETFEQLNQSRDVHLTLAGPLMGAQENTLVDDLISRHPERVTYMGPVYEERKTTFFENIDVLLFPTEYRVEAQPLVIFESFAFGKPAIAYGRACIPSLIGSDGGHVIPVDEEFVPLAQEIVETWIDQPKIYQDLCASVRNKAMRLREGEAEQRKRFIQHVKGQNERTLA